LHQKKAKSKIWVISKILKREEAQIITKAVRLGLLLMKHHYQHKQNTCISCGYDGWPMSSNLHKEKGYSKIKLPCINRGPGLTSSCLHHAYTMLPL
jgi:hypothetical protein